MNILIACEESQAVCIAFRQRGHNAYSVDIQPCSGGHPEWHIMDDALKYIDGNCEFITCDGVVHKISGEWDMLIAHPPCTYLSIAGACRLYPRRGEIDPNRYQQGLNAKKFFMKIYSAKCKKIAIENPKQLKIFNMPNYTQEIQPFQFGHPYTKLTRLWLKGLPQLVPTNVVSPIGPFVPSCTGRKDKSKYGYAKRGYDSKNRSKTFSGIAHAMAEQWG